jgi:zinc transporter 1/2/3
VEILLANFWTLQLLAPASEALSDPCLDGVISDYPWNEGICLMSIFALFIAELLMVRFVKRKTDKSHQALANGIEEACADDHSRAQEHTAVPDAPYQDDPDLPPIDAGTESPSTRHDESDDATIPSSKATLVNAEEGHQLHGQSYASQITAVMILEFGVIFHSIFIGLTLAVAGAEFVTLFIVLTLHQTFEGLAIGSRLATIEWRGRQRFTPYYMAFGYALSTPIAIAIGLGVRTSIHPHSRTSLIVNGVFDSISAGILIYTSLVELMAHDFVLNDKMQRAPAGEVWSAVSCMILGAALMALLGYWA